MYFFVLKEKDRERGTMFVGDVGGVYIKYIIWGEWKSVMYQAFDVTFSFNATYTISYFQLI